MFRFFALSLFAIVVILSPLRSATSQELEMMARGFRSSILYLKVRALGVPRQPGYEVEKVGTGFVVGIHQHILTAKHIFEGRSGQIHDDFEVTASIGSQDGPYFSIPRQNVHFHANGDFALLKARLDDSRQPLIPLPLCWSYLPRVGEDVFFLGYGSDYQLSGGRISSASGSRWSTEARLLNGFSGAPVFSVDEVVIGLTFGEITRISGQGTPMSGLSIFYPLRDIYQWVNNFVKISETCVQYRDGFSINSGARSAVRLYATGRIRIQSNTLLPYPILSTFHMRQLNGTTLDIKYYRVSVVLLSGFIERNPAFANVIIWGADVGLCKADRTSPLGFRPVGGGPSPQQFTLNTQSSISRIDLSDLTMPIGHFSAEDLEKSWICWRVRTQAPLPPGQPIQPFILHAADARSLGCEKC